MQKIDFLTAQAQLAKTMRQVCETNVPITINGLGKDEVVVMSAADFEKLNTGFYTSADASLEIATRQTSAVESIFREPNKAASQTG